MLEVGQGVIQIKMQPDLPPALRGLRIWHLNPLKNNWKKGGLSTLT